MSPVVRAASHANSWYSASTSELDSQLSGWLDAVVPGSPQLPEVPVKGCKAIIAPHAGYSYSGPPAAWAYHCVEVQHIKRVFILGPSHHVYLDGCALSQCDEYATPLGNLQLDQKTIAELRATGKFELMDQQTDEDEHSIEMHLPRSDVLIVPILVGSISLSSERSFGRLLCPYFNAPDTLFVISSDFCHWGTRFNYTYYLPNPSSAASNGVQLSRSTPRQAGGQDIDQSIEQLDKRAMELIAFDSSSSSSSTSSSQRGAKQAHDEFARYLKETKNTICGRHPIGVLLGALEGLPEQERQGWRLVWTRYEQSERVKDVKASSVSYASAYVCKV